MFKLIKSKAAQMFLCAGPAVIGFLIGLAIGFVLAILMAKGVIPGGTWICPKIGK
ncbi:YtxH domain-containing protein [Candidatus Woesearchaeota archaeon]|nr:YtxH domain-containing protein [Candidatus Woesearchaeota archaeon]